MPKKKKLKKGEAEFKCNLCGKVVIRELGFKVWTKSFCSSTGKDSRLYRISEPAE